MKIRSSPTLILISGALFCLPAAAGTLRFMPVPASDTDAQSGIGLDNLYTTAVDGGNSTGTERTVQGVILHSLTGKDNSLTADNLTLSAASGVLTDGKRSTDGLKADGVLAGVLGDFSTNAGADDNSEIYAVLDPSSLTSGKTYELRVYVSSSSNLDRMVQLDFVGDGQDTVSTGFFNEDDATTSPGKFTDAHQAYYISYHYVWDGATTPGFTVTQKFGAKPFLLYAITNQEVAPDPPVKTSDTADNAATVATEDPQPQSQVADQAAANSTDPAPVAPTPDPFSNDESLNENGSWVDLQGYGHCWQPKEVAADWRPYTNGSWHSCDSGWEFESSEPWAWATYHYGRWILTESAGWCWIPGTVWAPSWVSWRYGNGFVGWAPLPPAYALEANLGVSGLKEADCGINDSWYSFCNVQDFGAIDVGAVIIDRGRNISILASTSNITRYTTHGSGIYAGGPNVNLINSAINHSGGKLVSASTVKAHTISNLKANAAKLSSALTESKLTTKGTLSPQGTSVTGDHKIANKPILKPGNKVVQNDYKGSASKSSLKDNPRKSAGRRTQGPKLVFAKHHRIEKLYGLNKYYSNGTPKSLRSLDDYRSRKYPFEPLKKPLDLSPPYSVPFHRSPEAYHSSSPSRLPDIASTSH